MESNDKFFIFFLVFLIPFFLSCRFTLSENDHSISLVLSFKTVILANNFRSALRILVDTLFGNDIRGLPLRDLRSDLIC